MSTSVTGRSGVFISYSHQDGDALKELQQHLAYFQREGLINVWDDTQIKPGQRWFMEIQRGLASARVAIFLVSAAFLASEFITQEELPALLKAAEREGVTLLFVILSPSVFSFTPLARYQTVNPPDKPLSKMNVTKRAKTWVRVAQLVIEKLQGQALSRTRSPVDGVRPRDYLPLLPNPNFQPRPGEFEKLERWLLNQRQPARLGLVGVVGMGGVGKTQLAVEVAARYQDHFPDGIFWMPATGKTLADWRQKLAALAEQTGYLPPDDAPAQPDNEERQAKHVARYLADHPQALLILDNVEQPDLVASVLPTLAGKPPACAVLYTSRSKIAPPGVTIHPVEALPPEAALRLLLADTRPGVLSDALTGSQNTETEAANALCQAVGFLPLGLVHLRRLLERDPLLTVARLAQAVHERGALEFGNKEYLDAKSLFATFALSLEQVENTHARQVFYLAGFFPEATPIPLWLLGLAPGLGERWDSWEPPGKARLILHDASLLEALAEGQVQGFFLPRKITAWQKIA